MYSRTKNEDGSFQSRCLLCLRVVASGVESLAGLNAPERRHICPERALAQLRAGGLAQRSRDARGLNASAGTIKSNE